MLNRIIDAALHNRLVVALATLMAAAGGVFALLHLDIDAFPDTTPVQVQVNTTALSLSPEEVEQQITYPIEQALGGLPRLTQLRSVSKFGTSQVVVLFEDGTNVYFARQLVTERLGAVELPAGIERPKLGPPSTGLGEVFHYTVSLKGLDLSQLSEPERVEKLSYLRTVQDFQIKPKLRSVSGVAEVNSWGGYVKQYQVRPDLDKLAFYGLTFADLTAALQKGNKNVGGGGVAQNSQFLLVQGLGRTGTPDEIRAVVVGARGGVPVKVGDVAEVGVGAEVRRGAMSASGKGEAVLGLCFLTLGENGKTVTAAVQKKLAELRPTLPPDVEVEVVYDRTELVVVVIDTVRKNLFEGGLLVVAVLFAFLGNLRAAVIVTLAIPLSLLFAFSGMWAFGISASLLSLGAVDFGMVVDSSVVMVENCVRHIAHGDAEGRDKRDVVRDAAVEVRKPTLFGELIILIVYLPILTLEGTEGKLFRPMALTVVFALLGSMALSFTLMPVLASVLLPRRTGESQPWLMRLATWVYRPLFHFSMRHRLAVACVAAAALLFAFGYVAPNLGTEFVPKLSEGAIAMNVVRPAGTSLEESVAVNTRMERMILSAFPDEVRHAWSRCGTAEVATDPMGTELTDFYVTLHPRERWKKAATQEKLTEEIEKLVRVVPGQKATFEQPIEMRISEMETGIRADVGVRVSGDDFAVLTKKAAEVAAVLKSIPGSADVSAEQVTGQPVLQLKLRPEAAARYGVTAETALEFVRAVGSLPVGEVVEGQLRVPLAVRLPEALRRDAAGMGSILVRTPAGERVPLSRLVEINQVERPSTIVRESGQRCVIVKANVRGRDSGSFVAEARQAVAERVAMPPGRYHVEWAGRFERYESARARLLVVVPVALALIFLLLYFTYHNVVDALRVLVGVPFGWVGGVVALWVRDMPFSISAAVGFIALSGVAVLDDMILVSYVRQLRQKGVPLMAALEGAALTRLRPVLMTTLVASLGFLPMALSEGQGAEVQRPLATVVVGGVLAAMVMSLLVLRVLYVVFDALAHGLLWLFVKLLRVPHATAAEWVGLDVEVQPAEVELVAVPHLPAAAEPASRERPRPELARAP